MMRLRAFGTELQLVKRIQSNPAVAAPSQAPVQAPVMGYPAILSAVGPGRTRGHEVCRAALDNKRCPLAAINTMDATD
jgi:hypothetical protein